MNPLAITAFTATTAVGRGVDALATALRCGRSGLVHNDLFETAPGVALATYVGRVAGIEACPLPERFASLDCRNHRLAWMGLQADDFEAKAHDAVARYGSARVAVLIGTSTSTIAASEAAYREHLRTGAVPATMHRSDHAPGLRTVAGPSDDLHHLHATTAFVRDVLGAAGPCSTISTACSSSAKVFAQAARMIDVGLVDAAIVGGVDSLAGSTVFGFHALGLVSTGRCRPFDRRRDGINVGEAAGFALVERFDPARHADAPLLAGYGESSDAHHLSAPHPEGRGARQAIEAALKRAGITTASADYINLHGTATPKNDAVEAAVVDALFEPRTSVGSTKGWTGHALGAAGIVEAAVCLVAMRDGHAPGTLGCDEPDPSIALRMTRGGTARPVGIALSNAFAFGGNNCVLAFARDARALANAAANR